VPRFDAYFSELQQREGLPHVDLIRAWTAQEIATVETAIRAAVAASGILGMGIPNFAVSNQAKGNRAADHFTAKISPHLPAPNTITSAEGKGYPDMIFTSGGVGFCLEMKATSNWRNGDSNRRVLTSSPHKMRRLIAAVQICAPPAHMICTVEYSTVNSTVDGIRMDFLGPDSEVNIRLEASTSQKLLSQGAHQKFTMP
jgi:hypothetical protein